MPSIKLYKVFYEQKPDDKSGNLPRTYDEYEWRIPFDNTFAKNEPYTSEYVADSIENVLKGTIGIKRTFFRDPCTQEYLKLP